MNHYWVVLKASPVLLQNEQGLESAFKVFAGRGVAAASAEEAATLAEVGLRSELTQRFGLQRLQSARVCATDVELCDADDVSDTGLVFQECTASSTQ